MVDSKFEVVIFESGWLVIEKCDQKGIVEKKRVVLRGTGRAPDISRVRMPKLGRGVLDDARSHDSR